MVTLATGSLAPQVRASTPTSSRPIDIALLGLGCIGAAVTRRLVDGQGGHHIQVTGALVREPARRRDLPLRGDTLITSDPDAIFARRPDVVVELLGGLDPAFTLVARALTLGIPVVTANKSLLAARGHELDALAARAGVPLLYEASVLAGVPFLGALARRPHASTISRLQGIVNGTSNFVLARMAAGASFAAALAEAQRLGLAEPEPAHDVHGIDAAEKLTVLLRHFGWGHVAPSRVETSGIAALTPDHLEGARKSGGTIKPIVLAARSHDRIAAFSGPAFLPHAHRLSGVNGVDNAVVLSTSYGDLVHSGPGAGPDATAATVLDDVIEAAERRPVAPARRDVAIDAGELETGWFVSLSGAGPLPPCEEVADFLGSHGIWMRRSSRDGNAAFLLTYPAPKARIDGALAALHAAAGTTSLALRAVEA
ncbi:homoserine dehydrogenase [soil metagenome]|nr:homoserine dehydrogenase [Acidobacteriota bacterium]